MSSKVYLAVRVPADPARAFEAFTGEIGTWWRPDGLFRITPRGDGRLAFEPGEGGRLYTTLDDGEQFEIGRISVWDPGRRLVFAWRQASFAPDQSTEVEVRFEAVGEEYWPAYFDCVARNLKTDGRACIQTIVIQDALFERYRRGTDFIQQYIFPGGMLPSPARFRALAEQHGLRVTNELAFGKDYARTLRAWRDAFHHELAHVRAQGFDDRFIRTWDFYLAYCEAGFAVGDIDVMQFTLQK